METLKEKYGKFMELKFPLNSPKDEVISDLFIQLVDYDAYTAGLIDCVLMGKSIEWKKLFYDEKLEKDLTDNLQRNDIDGVSRKALESYLNRLYLLKDLIQEAKRMS